MEHRAISFYKDFCCKGADCPQTCCRGWKIVIDEATYQHIRQDNDPLVRKLRRHIAGNTDLHYIRQGRKGCPLQDPTGLCRLQLEGKTDCMSRICKAYPRRILGFGAFSETTLELACPEAARLFLSQCASTELTMVPQVAEPREILWPMDNSDPLFLDFLIKLRDLTIRQIYDCPHFDRKAMTELYVFYEGLHQLTVNNRLQSLEAQLDTLDLQGGDGSQLLFYPMEVADKVIAYNLDDHLLRRKLPRLHELLRQYYRTFDSLTESQAQDFFHENMEKMKAVLPDTPTKYTAYYVYYLLEMLLASYEDYHLLKVIQLGNMYLQIYMILDLVAWLDATAKGLPYDRLQQAMVLSNLERRMRHNTGVTDGILGRIRLDYPSPRHLLDDQ